MIFTESSQGNNLRHKIYSFCDGILSDCNISKVLFIMNDYGKPTGDCLVKFVDVADVGRAKRHNKKHIGTRFVIIEDSNEREFIYSVAKSNLGRFLREAFKKKLRILRHRSIRWVGTCFKT